MCSWNIAGAKDKLHTSATAKNRKCLQSHQMKALRHRYMALFQQAAKQPAGIAPVLARKLLPLRACAWRPRLTSFQSYKQFHSSITWHRRRGLLHQLCVRIARQGIAQGSLSLHLHSSYHLTMFYTGQFCFVFFFLLISFYSDLHSSNFFLFQYNIKFNYYVYYNVLFKRKISYLLRYCNKQLIH